MRAAVVSSVVAGALVCGCGVDETTSSAPASPQTPSSSAAPRGVDAVCSDVRAGIDAFNAGDFDETVEQFRRAVPKARRLQGSDPSRSSRLLLQAVRYYAALSPDDYPDASLSSSAFQRWKTVTLTLCVSGQDQLSPGPQDPEDSAIPA